MRQLAQVFMQACASPGAVAALAVLDHNNLLPVLPVEDLSASDDSSDDAPGESRAGRNSMLPVLYACWKEISLSTWLQCAAWLALVFA
jgi:hypothetical protein